MKHHADKSIEIDDLHDLSENGYKQYARIYWEQDRDTLLLERWLLIMTIISYLSILFEGWSSGLSLHISTL